MKKGQDGLLHYKKIINQKKKIIICQKLEKIQKQQKLEGGSILNTNVQSSGWTTDFEKQKNPEY